MGIKIPLGALVWAAAWLVGSASAAVDVPALQAALVSGDFPRLERELGALREAYLRGEQDDRPLDQALSAFASSHPKFDVQLEAWAARSPRSAFPHAARGIQQAHPGRH